MPCIDYAAYGSNVNPDRFGEYLGTPPTDKRFPKQGWLIGKGSVFFAGASKTWNAGVAFVNLGDSHSVIYRTYRVRWEQFLRVWGAENGMASIPESDEVLDAMRQASNGDTFRISTTGKYDTVAAIGATDRPVLTLTTSKALPSASPSTLYLDTIVAGLIEAPFDYQVLSRYIDRLRQGNPCTYLWQRFKPPPFCGSVPLCGVKAQARD